MTKNISRIHNQNKTKSIGAGACLGLIGMNAYFLPVTKDRFVRTAFNIVKEDTEDKIELFKDSAIQVLNKKVKPENKLFLLQQGIAEDIDAINAKCVELKKSITDKDSVSILKKSLEDNFKNFKKSEALMDNIASDAFKRIKWSNFTWGAGIGFILGCVMGSSASQPKFPPQD